MIIYLSKIKVALEGLKGGMVIHATDWDGEPETPLTIDANIALLDAKQAEVEELEDQLSQSKSSARQLEVELSVVADTIKNKAIGFHTAHPEVLNDYNIAVRKQYSKIAVPTTILVPEITADSDGQGFVLTTLMDQLATRYEWRKGRGTDPKDVNTIPTMQIFKSTTKTSFVDDDVEDGVRYFYSVRALNSSGNGPWSLAASIVQ